MNFFLKQLFKFLAPVIILSVTIPSFILWNLKENFYSIDSVVAGKGRYIIGYAYNEDNYGFLKWTALTSNDKKEVWALGSSRVLQFRANMFDTSFYNAGYTISSVNDFVPFLKSIPEEKYPAYLIIGLDQFMFNDAWGPSKTSAAETAWKTSFKKYPSLSNYEAVLKDLLVGKYKPTGFKTDSSINRIGINAAANNTGFRNDGSMYYGNQIEKLINKDTSALDCHYADTYDRIEKGNRRFEYGAVVNEKAVAVLKDLLAFCKTRHIQVVAFLPPFADQVYKRMITSGKYIYLTQIYRELKPIVEKYQYELYDFSNVSLCQSNDGETIDGFHGSEVTYQRLLILMLERGSVLNKVTSKERLKSDLEKAQSDYLIYEN